MLYEVITVVSAARVVGRSADKQAISRMTGAVALDMESAALAQVAEERGVPFVVLRTVSDLVEEELPLDFNAFRITSYNVCYTKLLRERQAPVIADAVTWSWKEDAIFQYHSCQLHPRFTHPPQLSCIFKKSRHKARNNFV